MFVLHVPIYLTFFNRNFSLCLHLLIKSRPIMQSRGKFSATPHYTNVTKRCNLCIAEKYYIICQPQSATLNKDNELISKCRHNKKFLLKNVK